MASALAAARRQAQLTAQVRFAPQERVLQQALGTADQAALQSIAQARGGASALVAAINRARPGLKRGYKDAASTATAARGDLLGHLASLGPAADPFSAAVAREQAGTTSRAAQEQANALGELSLRGVSARSGGFAAETNARRQLALDQQSILSQLAGVASDQGAFTAQTVGDIQAKNAQLANAVNVANIHSNATLKAAGLSSAATVKAAGLRSAATVRAARIKGRTATRKAAAAAHKPMTDAQSQHIISHIGAARSWITRIHALYPHKSSSDIRALLAGGGQIQTGTAQSTTANGKTTTHPTFESVPAFGNPDVVNAAYDLYTFNGLSPRNQHALRRVRGLPSQWRQWNTKQRVPRTPASGVLPF